MADEADSKSVAGDRVRVQVPLPAVIFQKSASFQVMRFLFCIKMFSIKFGILCQIILYKFLPLDQIQGHFLSHLIILFSELIRFFRILLKFLINREAVESCKVIHRSLCSADQLCTSVLFQKNFC